MKHTPLIFIFTLMMLAVGCQETSTNKNTNNSSSNYCTQNPWACGNTTSGNNGNTSCSNQSYWTQPGCAGFCQYNSSHSSCTSGTTTGTTTSGSNTGGTTYPPYINPYPNFYSGYVDKNWINDYPYIPSISCEPAKAPAGLSYTPYETRKGTVTLRGGIDYDPASGQPFLDTTSELLRSKSGAQNFFWGDSILKIRFIANIQPDSTKSDTVCPGRVPSKSGMKGYGRIKFNLTLVGITSSGTTHTVGLGTKIIDVNKCTSAIDLSSYAAQYPGGIYLKISNVYGNQYWSPFTYHEASIHDQYGFIYPQNPYVSGTWMQVRTSDCWSLDIEVASNGTKTFN